MQDSKKHPCFNRGAVGNYGRVHLPVAPQCNIKCNYCNRKYDCVNESRPGVTSSVLKPSQAAAYMDKVLEKAPYITVAGIAGPGDPFANAASVLETMRRIKEKHPHLLFCLSSNGLNVPSYLDAIAEVGVTHMTITVNAVDTAIGAQIYSWVKENGRIYRGQDAAHILLERQLAAIEGLKKRNIIVKVNTVVIPGINDAHVEAVAQKVAALGADLQNLIPIKPTEDTPFSHIIEPSHEVITTLRKNSEQHMEQMTHCKRCRADAVGLLNKDESISMCGTLQACASLEVPKKDARPYVAVASREGFLINQHLGETQKFQIWWQNNGQYSLLEERLAPLAGCGPQRWEHLGSVLHDCSSVLATAAGEHPRDLLEKSGLKVHICSGFIQDALDTFYKGGNMQAYAPRKAKACGGGCVGNGLGC